jgi:hypothetical protein
MPIQQMAQSWLQQEGLLPKSCVAHGVDGLPGQERRRTWQPGVGALALAPGFCWKQQKLHN